MDPKMFAKRLTNLDKTGAGRQHLETARRAVDTPANRARVSQGLGVAQQGLSWLQRRLDAPRSGAEIVEREDPPQHF